MTRLLAVHAHPDDIEILAGGTLALLAGRGAKRELGFPDSTLELSPLSDAELARFYGGATAVLVPSRYEGFGLPALEAMACGAPVVTSRGGATEEVAGGAAVLVDPLDPASIVAGIEGAGARRGELRELGFARAAAFSWDETARRTVEVYREASG